MESQVHIGPPKDLLAVRSPLPCPSASSTAHGTSHHHPHPAPDGRPRAVVIGAGLGGLAAGIHLAHQGWKVTILEQNARSGGRMNVLQERGFQIDMGPTMLMMPDVIEALFTACGRRLEDYLTLQRIAPAYRIVWPDGTQMEMGNSLEELVANARRIAPEEADRIPALFAAMQAKYENARYNFIEQPFNSLADMVRPSTLQGLLKALPINSVADFVGRHLRHEKLCQAFTFQTLYLGISPYECPSIYALLPYIEMEFGVWFPQGGTYALVRALERLFYELGGEIHFHQRAERVLLEGRRAVGVRTTDGHPWHADAILCNLDAPMAYSRLVPPEVRRKHTDDALSQKQYGCSGYLLYLGVKGLESDWPHNTILLSDDYEQVLEDICHTKILPSDPAMHVCIPTRTDPTLAPPGQDVVYILVPCPNIQGKIDWQSEGPLLRKRVLDKLEAHGMPNLRKQIVFERTFTPPEFESLYGCYAGAAYGSLSPTFFQSAYFRPHIRSEDVHNLYFVGAGTHPGGGVPIVLTSGRLAAEEIIAHAR